MSDMPERLDKSTLLARIKSRLQAIYETAYTGLSCTGPKLGESQPQIVMWTSWSSSPAR